MWELAMRPEWASARVLAMLGALLGGLPGALPGGLLGGLPGALLGLGLDARAGRDSGGLGAGADSGGQDFGAGGDDWGTASHRHSNAAIPESPSLGTRIVDEPAKWMAALRTSLMRDNYDYQSPEEEPALGRRGAGDTRDTSDTSGDTSGQSRGDSGSGRSGEQSGPSDTQDHDPSPRSLNHDSSDSEDRPWEHGSSEARPDSNPARPAAPASSRAVPAPGPGAATLELPRRRAAGPAWRRGVSTTDVYGLDADADADVTQTTPPRSTDRASLLAELDKEFEMRRQGYLESLFELEDQLRPMYVRGSPAGGDPRGPEYRHAQRRGERQDLTHRYGRGRNGIKSKKVTAPLPYVDTNDGIRRYKVDKNDMLKFPSFGEVNAKSLYETYTQHEASGDDGARSPRHRAAHKVTQKDSRTKKDISSEYLERRKKPRRPDVGRPGRAGRAQKGFHSSAARGGHGKRRKKPYHQHKELKSRYLEGARLPKLDHESSFVQRYASRRDKELLADTSAAA